MVFPAVGNHAMLFIISVATIYELAVIFRVLDVMETISITLRKLRK